MIIILSTNARERLPKVTTANSFEEAKELVRTECRKYVDKTGLEWDEDEINDAIEETESENEFAIEFDDDYGDDWYAAKVVKIEKTVVAMASSENIFPEIRTVKSFEEGKDLVRKECYEFGEIDVDDSEDEDMIEKINAVEETESDNEFTIFYEDDKECIAAKVVRID